MMKKFRFLFISILALAALASCKNEQMLAEASRVTVKCAPSPLTLKAGSIDADLAINYPNGYFNSKAIVELTPVLVYQGGEVAIKPIRFQGDKVKDNYRVVRSTGSTISQHVSFPYREGMSKAHLELRSRYTLNKKSWVKLPDIKVAEGCNITENLADVKGSYTLKDHCYQEIITLNPEGQVMYSINSAEVKNSELKSSSIKDFKAKLGEYTLNERTEITGIEVVAYASPEGKESFNNKLSANRSKTANKAFDQVAKGEELTGVKTRVSSVGEDWEGFQEMVKKSDIEDKDLILRVLSMYNDPKVREREIRNLSSIYRDLADDVLPQLRRARFIANVEYTNYSEEELKSLIHENVDILDEPALLKAASICSDAKDKKMLYNKAIEKYNSEKARFNLACVALDENDLQAAVSHLSELNADDVDVLNLNGVIALRQNDLEKANSFFKKSVDRALELFENEESIEPVSAAAADALMNQGLVALLGGRYSEAIVKCGLKGTNAALARLLAGHYDDALVSLGDCNCAKSNYMRAIIFTRKADYAAAKEALAKACAQSPELKQRAETDLEFTVLK